MACFGNGIKLKMNDTEFKNECDRLATLEAQTHNSWGRWFLDDGLLCTWVCTPKIGFCVVDKMFCYSKWINDLKYKDQQEDFYKEMLFKEWMGENGLHDLKRAFKYLSKKQNESSDDL